MIIFLEKFKIDNQILSCCNKCFGFFPPTTFQWRIKNVLRLRTCKHCRSKSRKEAYIAFKAKEFNKVISLKW